MCLREIMNQYLPNFKLNCRTDGCKQVASKKRKTNK